MIGSNIRMLYLELSNRELVTSGQPWETVQVLLMIFKSREQDYLIMQVKLVVQNKLNKVL